MKKNISLCSKIVIIGLIFIVGHLWSLAPIYARSSEAQRAYRQAQEALSVFAKSRKVRYRSCWLRVIGRFKRVYFRYPESPVAPKALYKTARLYEELYRYSGRRGDLIYALKYYRLLWERYPQNPLVKNALKRSIFIYENYLRNPVQALALKRQLRRWSTHQKPPLKAQARPSPRRSSPKTSRTTLAFKKTKEVRDIRHWSSQDYSRVVIDLSGKVKFKVHLLKAHAGKPPRLYIDCTPARLSPYIKPLWRISDGLLYQVRVGQYRPKTVRIVLDLKSLSDYRVFFLNDPSRLVVDLVGNYTPSEGQGCRNTHKIKIKEGPLSLAQQLGLCVKRIVIDPGHGGKDSGALGRSGLKEKEVVFKVARLLAQELRKRGFQIIFTRNRDVFLPLEHRTAIANMRKADLFVSVHVNSSPNRHARGVETYYLNFARDKEAMRVAALENATSARSLGDLQDLLKHLLLNTKIKESRRLAYDIQKSLVRELRKRYPYVKDRGVKTAPFVVLIGTRMPAVLVEIGFISNRYEERRLRNQAYLKTIARGLAQGIERYMKQIKISYR